MIVPDRIIQTVLDGKRTHSAEMACVGFGPADNECLILVMNGGAMGSHLDWLLKAALAYKADGNQPEADAIKGFMERLQRALLGSGLVT